ncbi:MAG: DUF3298 domain-containing protein [Lachnospiraceae bacterium]|nr:DUF3298 domain-containing protein [Lachnospiraceae bacterium]
MKRVLTIVMVFAMVVTLLAGCDDKPTTRDIDKDRKPTEEVTGKPTEKVTPTGEPDAPTPTEEATPTPTEEPTATPTPTPTEGPSLPVVAAETGPAYVIGNVSWYRTEMDENDPNAGAHQQFIYIVDPGYGGLAEAIDGEAYIAAGEYTSFIDTTASAAIESGEDVSRWFSIGEAKIGRADSLVFSFSRVSYSYLGGAHPNYRRRGWNFSTKTGKSLILWQMVRDYDALRDLVIRKIEESKNYTDAMLDENWKDRIAGLFRGETISWVATDKGLEIWFDEGEIAAIAAGEIKVRINVEDYPELFAPEWIGGYDGSIQRRIPDCAAYHTDLYNATIPVLAKGIKTMTWSEAAEILKKSGVEYEGADAEEAAEYEENAFLEFRDKTTGRRYYLMFWPFTEGGEVQLESIIFRDYGTTIYIDNAYGLRPTRYSFVDPMIYNDYDKVVAVEFDNADDLGLVVDVTIPYYIEKRNE